MKHKYINREISWLKFNARVLQEVADPSVPIIEKLRFLGIYSNNLDEFYKVRYATILRAIELKSKVYHNIIEDQTNVELLNEINRVVAEQQKTYDSLYQSIIEELANHQIYFVNEQSLSDTQEEFVKEYFETKLRHTIAILYSKKNIPLALKDGAFYMYVTMTLEDDSIEFALIEVPTDIFPRFVQLPSEGTNSYIMFLEDVIRKHLKDIFFSFRIKHIVAHSVKITRDAELSIDNDIDLSLVQSISESVEDRSKGEPVRMVYDKNLPPFGLENLKKMLHLTEYDNLLPGGKYHNKRDFMKFPNLGRTDLEYPKIKPIVSQPLTQTKDYFKVLSEKDMYIYTPYHDYSTLLQFLRNAAIDPLVTTIKMTIYRVADDSQVMSALINAARNGKEVIAVVELKARFDEAHNIQWTRELQEAGVKVIFGVPGLKVHAKLCLIERSLQDGYSENYAIVSTGNFNESTAQLYTDFTLFSSNQEIVNEVAEVFDFFKSNYLIKKYSMLVVSPWQTRKKVIKFINKEIKNHKKGLPAQINLKMNGLSDKEMIDHLYNAAEQGVEVRLLIRGVCSIVPRENLKITSVIDKFLEHPRMYWFKNAGNDKVFISSADFMTRNLDIRVEVSCPIFDQKIKEQVIEIFELGFNDNVKGRIVQPGLQEEYQKNDLAPNRSQETIYQYLLSQEL